MNLIFILINISDLDTYNNFKKMINFKYFQIPLVNHLLLLNFNILFEDKFKEFYYIIVCEH